MSVMDVSVLTETATAIRADEHPLESIPDFPKKISLALRALGYLTLEQFLGVAQVAGRELGKYLGVDIDTLLAEIPQASMATSIPADILEAIVETEYPLGFAIDTMPSELLAPAAAGDPPEPSALIAPAPNVNLIPQMPPIRDQGTRGTCVAHAAVAALEHFFGLAGAYQDMSEQFLYWNCKRRDGFPNSSGTWLASALPSLSLEGCCLEATWPYNTLPVAGNEGQGPPPGRAQIEALQYRTKNHHQLPPTSVQDIKAELTVGRCVAFSIPVFNTWYRNPRVSYTGEIINPVPGEVRVGGHAMCFVGYVDLPQNPELGGGRFLLRNSWGTRWGVSCAYGVGYGTVPYRYIESYCKEAYSIF
jgi:hypothetical protein